MVNSLNFRISVTISKSHTSFLRRRRKYEIYRLTAAIEQLGIQVVKHSNPKHDDDTVYDDMTRAYPADGS